MTLNFRSSTRPSIWKISSLLGALTVTLGFSAPVSAAVIVPTLSGSCAAGATVAGNPTEASFKYSDIILAFGNPAPAVGNPGITGTALCYSGDKLFTFTGFNVVSKVTSPDVGSPFEAFFDDDSFTLTAQPDSHRLAVTASSVEAFTGGPNVFDYFMYYTVSVLSPDQVFRGYRTAATQSEVEPEEILDFDKTLATVYGVSTATEASPGGNGNFVFTPAVTSLAFTSKLAINSATPPNAGISQFSDSVFQTSSVPGPLPIFGAAVAFSQARKMRKRIKSIQSWA